MNLRFLATFIFIAIFGNPLIANALEKAGGDYVCNRVKKAEHKHIAVFPFTDSESEESSQSRLSTARFMNAMTDCTGIKLIDKQHTNKVLEQQAAAQSGLIDSKSAPKIGKMIGADSLVFGVLLQGALEVRLVDAESGEILGATVQESPRSSNESSNQDKQHEKPGPVVAQMKKEEASQGLQDRQLRAALRRMYRRHPALFIYVVSSDTDLARFRKKRPKAAERFFGRFDKMPTRHKQHIIAIRKATHIKMASDSKISTRMQQLKRKAARTLRTRRGRN